MNDNTVYEVFFYVSDFSLKRHSLKNDAQNCSIGETL